MKTICITIGIIILLYASYRIYRIVTLDDNLERILANDAVIIDVRTETEYNSGHIDGSLNISLGTIRVKYTELDKNKTYITCCSHGLRSVKAESILKEKGFKNVHNGGVWSDLQEIINDLKKND